MEQTLVILKPDAMHRGLVGTIIARFERAGIRLVACKMIQASPELVSEHYGDLDIRYGAEVKSSPRRFSAVLILPMRALISTS